MAQFLVGDARQRRKGRTHCDVFQVVQPGKDAHLAELGHSGEQHEAQVLVHSFDDGVEPLEHVTDALCLGDVFDVVYDWLVVLVYQHRHAIAICELFDEGDELIIVSPWFYLYATLASDALEVIADALLQLLRCAHSELTEIYADDGILFPGVIALRDPQSHEQFPPPLKDCLQRREQQTFAKATGTGEKIDPLGIAHHLVNPAGFVNVQESAFDDVAKCLYTDG